MPQKPFYRTSEFWLTMFASFVGFILSSNAYPDSSIVYKILGIAAMVLSTMGYSISRGIAKSGQSIIIQPINQNQQP
jgi:hypothetical protein